MGVCIHKHVVVPGHTPLAPHAMHNFLCLGESCITSIGVVYRPISIMKSLENPS